MQDDKLGVDDNPSPLKRNGVWFEMDKHHPSITVHATRRTFMKHEVAGILILKSIENGSVSRLE